MSSLSTILDQPAEFLQISQSLKTMFRINRLSSLKDLLQKPMEEWFQLKGFNQHLLQDLMNFMEMNAIVALIQD